MSKRELTQISPQPAAPLPVGAALLGSFSVQPPLHSLLGDLMAPWEGPSCGWLLFPGVLCFCGAASSPFTLPQLPDLLPAPASPFVQQIQPFLPLPSMKERYSPTWHAMAQRRNQQPSSLLHSVSLVKDRNAGQCDK